MQGLNSAVKRKGIYIYMYIYIYLFRIVCKVLALPSCFLEGLLDCWFAVLLFGFSDCFSCFRIAFQALCFCIFLCVVGFLVCFPVFRIVFFSTAGLLLCFWIFGLLVRVLIFGEHFQALEIGLRVVLRTTVIIYFHFESIFKLWKLPWKVVEKAAFCRNAFILTAVLRVGGCLE